MINAPMKVVINCATGEETVEPLTAEEIAQLETDAKQIAEQEAARAAEEAALLAAKQSAQDKLKKLGLSDLEIAAITGA